MLHVKLAWSLGHIKAEVVARRDTAMSHTCFRIGMR
jgi:hypothetical protein